MKLFGIGKKKNVEEELVQCSCGGMCKPSAIAAKKAAEKKPAGSGCCCGGNCNAETMAEAEKAKQGGSGIKVLGGGCAKCNALELATKTALEQLNMDTTSEHVRDFAVIASYGVMSTPALVVDGKVVSYGKALNTEEVVAILKKVRS